MSVAVATLSRAARYVTGERRVDSWTSEKQITEREGVSKRRGICTAWIMMYPTQWVSNPEMDRAIEG